MLQTGLVRHVVRRLALFLLLVCLVLLSIRVRMYGYWLEKGAAWLKLAVFMFS